MPLKYILMLDKDRSDFLNTIQKNITKSCFELCGTKSKCQATCFKKYIANLNVVTEAVKSQAYTGFPEENNEHSMYYTEICLPMMTHTTLATRGDEAA